MTHIMSLLLVNTSTSGLEQSYRPSQKVLRISLTMTPNPGAFFTVWQPPSRDSL
jgi:hypothetical protein